MPANANHLWLSLSRGTTLGALAGAQPFAIASAQVALQLQDADMRRLICPTPPS